MLNELWSFLSAWYNLPYTILIALALLLAAVQLVGLVGAGDSDVSRIAQSIYARLDKATVAMELRGASLDEQIDQMLDRKTLDAQLAQRRARLLPAGKRA